MEFAGTKRIAIYCFLLLTCCKNKHSETTGTNSDEKNISAPKALQTKINAKMHIPVLTKDFGDAIRGDTLEYDFIVSNTGSDTLTILELVPSCPCVIAEMTVNKIAPNDSAKIHVSYHTATKMGYDEKELIVSGNGFPPKLTIRLSSTIHAKSHK